MAEEALKNFVSNNDSDFSLAYTRVYGAFKAGISNKESTEYYNNWAEKYDEECQKSVHYSGPIFARQALDKYYGSNIRDKISIIDIAAGTGYVAEELQKCGFKIMDGLDPSEGMLAVAKSKNLYRNYICAYLEEGKTPIKDSFTVRRPYAMERAMRDILPGQRSPFLYRFQGIVFTQALSFSSHANNWALFIVSPAPPSCICNRGIIPKTFFGEIQHRTPAITELMKMDSGIVDCDDEYDCLVVAGGMGEGHIPCSGLYEMIRIVKPGGLVCIVLREEFLSYVEEYKDRLEPLMDKLEKDGKWKKISREVIPNYTFNKNGVVYMYEVC